MASKAEALAKKKKRKPASEMDEQDAGYENMAAGDDREEVLAPGGESTFVKDTIQVAAQKTAQQQADFDAVQQARLKKQLAPAIKRYRTKGK